MSQSSKLDVGEILSVAFLVVLTSGAIVQIVAYLRDLDNALSWRGNVFGSVLLLFFGLIAALFTWSYATSRGSRGFREYADLLLAGVGAVSFLTVGLSEISIALAIWGHGALSDTVGTNGEVTPVSVHDVVETFLCEACRTIPGLEAPDTIGWRPAVEDPSLTLGACLLTYKVILILGIVSSVITLWKSRRGDSEEEAAQTANKDADEAGVPTAHTDTTDAAAVADAAPGESSD